MKGNRDLFGKTMGNVPTPSGEMYGRQPGNVWKATGKYVKGNREIYGRQPGNVWKATGKYMERNWGKYGTKVRNTWKKAGKRCTDSQPLAATEVCPERINLRVEIT
jgi:hypothetical protein